MANETIIGGYRLQNLMMTGQTSQVWEVVETSSNRHFGLKLLLPETTREPEHQRYLYHEAEVGIACHHPKVIRILKFVRSKTNPYLIMEFFPGANLKLRLMRKQPLVQEKAHSIIEQAAQGLGHINDKGWVHRDVKPDNILVNSAGDVRIIDFALAQRVGKGRGLFGWFRKGRGTTSGTRSYMSPEQIRAEKLDARADLYSFGATMYELVTGRPPFRGMTAGELLHKHIIEKPTSPQVLNPQVTDECTAIILRLLAKKKAERFRDFDELVAAFRGVRVFQGDKLDRPPQY